MLRYNSIFILSSLMILGCNSLKKSNDDTDLQFTRETAQCQGSVLTLCEFKGSFSLENAIKLVKNNIETAQQIKKPSSNQTLQNAQVACAEVSYPGNEKALLREENMRGTFICLFNNQAVMNMALNRLSTFIEDFKTVDLQNGYSDKIWTKDQLTEATKGHNLESQDIERYLMGTANFIQKRAQSLEPGVQLENEFLENYIKAKIDPKKGKTKSIFVGIFMPSSSSLQTVETQIKVVLGHEIFHSLYFHSEKMQSVTQKYLDSIAAEDILLLKKRLMQKGYAIENDDGMAPSLKQKYMYYNEAAAYLLESGACNDGAFINYIDEDSMEPTQPLPGHAPLVVKYAQKLRELLIYENVISTEWASEWSPDLIKLGCVP